MAMRIGGEGGGGKISLKSGFDRFLRLNKQEQMHGVSEAVGTLEQFEPVWQVWQHPALLHHASCTLHLAPCTLHLASCILHLASCILHLASCIFLFLQEGQCALLGPNNKFLTADEDDLIVCTQLTVGEGEVIKIRSNKEKEDLTKKIIPIEEQGNAADVELKFTKKFMKFQDHKYKARLDVQSQVSPFVSTLHLANNVLCRVRS